MWGERGGVGRGRGGEGGGGRGESRRQGHESWIANLRRINNVTNPGSILFSFSFSFSFFFSHGKARDPPVSPFRGAEQQ